MFQNIFTMKSSVRLFLQLLSALKRWGGVGKSFREVTGAEDVKISRTDAPLSTEDQTMNPDLYGPDPSKTSLCNSGNLKSGDVIFMFFIFCEWISLMLLNIGRVFIVSSKDLS